ncbi:MAG: prepilin-type N-terminal cleavage/methylation domain-containing protein [Patescibacteria group bacterium]
MKNYGFTLIELVVAFSVIALLSTVGIASFVNYSRSQALTVSAKDLVNTLNLAKSRSLSQVLPSQCSGQSLVGYEVRLCISTQSCASGINYELNVVCSGSIYSAIETKNLPVNINFDTVKTTTTSFIFPVLTGGVKMNGGDGTIVLSGYYGQEKIITVSNSGIIK